MTKLSQLKIDPEFQGQINPPSSDEEQQLEQNILEERRLLNPIITWNGYIVDSHTRYRILKKHAFLNVFLCCPLFQKHCNSVKGFSADDCFMVLLHTIHIHLTRVPVPVELFIRKGLLEQGIPYIPFIGQQEVEVQWSHRWAGMPSSFRSAAIVPAPLPASTSAKMRFTTFACTGSTTRFLPSQR